MYGEVVQDRPRNWWTDKPVDDTYIVLSEFLKDMDDLKTYDEVVIHINSIGGDAFAGLAIYNRLRELPGNVTTINDSLAASAGSIILQGGKTRKVRRASSTMVHNASTLLIDYFDSAALEKIQNELHAVDETLAQVYIARGVSKENARNDMNAETWMTGDEAVKKGYADEVIEDGDELGAAMALDRSYITLKGHRLCAMAMPDELPEGIDLIDTAQNTISAAEKAEDNTNEGGISDMEITNLAELCAAYPELTDQLTAQAQAEERERIRDIYDIAQNVTDSELVNNALYGEERMSARDFAFAAMKNGAVGTQQANASAAAAVLNALEADAEESGANDVKAATNMAQRDGESDPQNMTDEQIKARVKAIYKN